MFVAFSIVALLLSGSIPALAGPFPKDSVDELADIGTENLKAYLAQNPSAAGCTFDNAARRKEWMSLTRAEKQEYRSAVECLASTPAKYSAEEVPGARSRYDDFVALHMRLTPIVHSTANFLGWHRYYIWAYEKALREECGYTGYQPYWHWPYYAEDVNNAVIFDGSEDSMGANGEYAEYKGFNFRGHEVAAASGGDCLKEGPFHDFKVNLGPVAAMMPGLPQNPQRDGYGYNPRCIRRDLNQRMADATTANRTAELITSTTDIYWFQTVMQSGTSFNDPGVHGGGHFTYGGDPGGDFYVSPGDPLFWLHHGMIDRVWWIWQNQDPSVRLFTISGGTQMFNPNSPNGTLDDPVELEVNGPTLPLRDMLDSTSGPFCYVYE